MRRTYAVLLTCMMLLFGAAAPARAADPGDYLDEHGDPGHVSIPAGHTIGVDWDAGSTALSGWYAVTQDVIVNHTLYVDGEVHLILCDEASLTVIGSVGYAGIEVTTGDSLTVYAQSTGDDMGSLTAQGNSGGAGIGGSRGAGNGDDGQDCGTITINGGMVNATAENGTGIGGGRGGDTYTGGGGDGGDGGTITINGGRVNATNTYQIGIGGGGGGEGTMYSGDGGDGSAITIRGGTVTANSIREGRGGLNGSNGDSRKVVITGGSVDTTSIQAVPTNGGANGNGDEAVYRTQVKLQGVSAVTKVLWLVVDGASYYGTRDLYTDDQGYLYLYLPSGAAATRARTTAGVYSGRAPSNIGGLMNRVTPSADSALQSLSLSLSTLDPGELKPPFSAGTISYTATVPNAVTWVKVTPTAHGRTALTKVNTRDVPSGNASGEIPLSVGANRIDVVCTAEDGSSTTYTVILTRFAELAILAQPSDRTVAEGRRASFTVRAEGAPPLNYQWYVDRGDGRGFVEIDSAGARTATYRTSAVKLEDSGALYACRVSDDTGAVWSDPATLTVIEKAAPQTGDGSHLPLWLLLMLLSGLGLMALLAGRRGFGSR